MFSQKELTAFCVTQNQETKEIVTIGQFKFKFSLMILYTNCTII